MFTILIQCSIILLNLLFIVNSTRQKIDKPKEEMLVISIHSVYFSNDTKQSKLTMSSETTIKELKREIITKILFPNNDKPPIEESYLMLFYKGRILNNDKVNLKDIKFENNGKIIVNKSDVSMDVSDIEESKLLELVNNIKFMFELDDEVIKRALKKNSYNLEDDMFNYGRAGESFK